MTGGSHERKRRAGTENVPAIAGLGAAARLGRERLPEMQTRVAALRDRLENQAMDADCRDAHQRPGAPAAQHHQSFLRKPGGRGGRHRPRS